MATYWTNESVLAFAGGRDPLDAIEEAARDVVFEAVENGWEGPPFDPFELARIFDIEVVPKDEVRDARTVPVRGGEVAIEYNPTRPRHRLRFSLAHEIAHTLFPDVAKIARYRDNPAAGPPDGWQLELLCNVAAAELLMPTDTLPMLREGPLEIEELMELRADFGVSTEVLLRRATKLATYPVAMFAASRTDPSAARSPFRIDYTVPSRAWAPALDRGERRPPDSVLAECTAVGFTAKRQEDWSDELRGLAVQAVGTPPFPGQRFPRVLGAPPDPLRRRPGGARDGGALRERERRERPHAADRRRAGGRALATHPRDRRRHPHTARRSRNGLRPARAADSRGAQASRRADARRLIRHGPRRRRALGSRVCREDDAREPAP